MVVVVYYSNKVITIMVIRSLDDPTSICGCRFVTPWFEVHVVSGMSPFHSLHMGSYQLPIDTNGLSLTAFEFVSWRKKCFRPSTRPPPVHLDTMTNTTLEATAWLSGNKHKKISHGNMKQQQKENSRWLKRKLAYDVGKLQHYVLQAAATEQTFNWVP